MFGWFNVWRNRIATDIRLVDITVDYHCLFPNSRVTILPYPTC